MYAAKHLGEKVPFTQVHPFEIQVRVCGYEPVAVEVTELAEAQDGCYFGWKDSEGYLSLIQPSMLQLKMCSVDYFQSAIARGDGSFVPLSVVEATQETP